MARFISAQYTRKEKNRFFDLITVMIPYITIGKNTIIELGIYEVGKYRLETG